VTPILLGALALAGCGKKRSLEVPARPSAPALVAAPKPLEFHAPDGTLKGSDVHVEWLEIPLGFRSTGRDYERHHLFEADGVTMERARDFLAQRMLTGQVDEGKGYVYYRRVLPVDGAADAVPLNVHVSHVGPRVTLDVELATEPNVKALPFEEAKRAAEAEQKFAH
jgi:hypothetical protein